MKIKLDIVKEDVGIIMINEIIMFDKVKQILCLNNI